MPGSAEKIPRSGHLIGGPEVEPEEIFNKIYDILVKEHYAPAKKEERDHFIEVFLRPDPPARLFKTVGDRYFGQFYRTPPWVPANIRYYLEDDHDLIGAPGATRGAALRKVNQELRKVPFWFPPSLKDEVQQALEEEDAIDLAPR